MNIEIPVVRIALHTHTIPIPWGMTVVDAWDRIWTAEQDGSIPWPADTILKGYVSILVHPNGRIVGVHQ